MCRVRLDAFENVDGHWVHGWGLSPECTFPCLVRLSFLEKVMRHRSHWKALTRVCVTPCFFRLLLLENTLPQSLCVHACIIFRNDRKMCWRGGCYVTVRECLKIFVEYK